MYSDVEDRNLADAAETLAALDVVHPSWLRNKLNERFNSKTGANGYPGTERNGLLRRNARGVLDSGKWGEQMWIPVTTCPAARASPDVESFALEGDKIGCFKISRPRRKR